MDAPSIDQSDIDRLNEKDRAELRQFLHNETTRSHIQQKTHALTEICFKKCITGTIKSGKLDKTEEACLANCSDRFFDVSNLIVKHLGNMRHT